MATNRNAAIGFIFVTLLIDTIGFGIIIPVVPSLIEQLIHGNISQASVYSGWLTIAYGVTQFVFAPLLGNLSDKYGRRPILLMSLFGLGVDYLFLSWAPTIGWLFVGRIIAGFAGASFTTATAYIADISTPEKRQQNFGMVGAAFGLGFIIGPAVGGLLGGLGLRVPFIVAACLSLANCLYGFFVLPESLAKENRRPLNWKKIIPVASLVQLRRYKTVTGLFLAFFLIYLAANAVQSTWSFFTIKQFDWNTKMIGLSLSLVGLLVGGVQGGLIRYTSKIFGNKKSIYIGLGFYSLGLILFAFATQSWMMFAFLIPYCLGGICGPALQSTITGQVPPNEQGELQGGLTSIMSLANILGPFVMTNLFAFFTKPDAPVHFAGAPFLLGAILMLTSLYLTYLVIHKHHEIS